MNYYILTLSLIIGYLFGSVPFALVIGKIFYNTDIRNYGSGNLGGTNTGRVLGKKAGISVMVLDVLKVVVASAIVYMIQPQYFIFAAFASAIGHCYPIFAGFRGGKAVATLFGFLLSLAIFNNNALAFIIPFACFILILFLFKMVSLSSILTGVMTAIYIYFTYPQALLPTILFAILIIYRHHENITRILNGTEKKIKWM